MRTVSTVLFLLAALINLAPLIGVVSAERLEGLYAIPFEEPNLQILMRHRAVLFGIVGGLLVAAAAHPPLRSVATAAGLMSMLSFVALLVLVGGASPELKRIAGVDLVGIVSLVGAMLIDSRASRVPA